MLGPVLRVGVPLDWICHLEPVSSDVQLQKEGSLAQPKSQANQRKAAKCVEERSRPCTKGVHIFITLFITKGQIAKSPKLKLQNDPGACHDMTAGYTLELDPITWIIGCKH